MRRTAVPAVLLALTITAVACGDDDSSDATDVSLVPASPPDSVPAPSVDVPEETPTSLVVTELTAGTGAEAAAGDIVMVNYVGVRSEDGTQFDSSYGRTPYPVRLGDGAVIAGWDQGLVGVQAGEQVQLDIPSDLAYGNVDRGEVIKAGDALTFVIDVLAVIPPNDPADEPTADEIPTSEALVAELTTDDTVAGDGTTADLGMTVFVNYVIARADNGAVLEDTWPPVGVRDSAPAETSTTTDSSSPGSTSTTAPTSSGAVDLPKQMILVQGQEIPGLIDGIVGMKVGGRRTVTVPFEEAYGAEGRPPMGLPAETDIVIVVDLVGAY